MPPTSSDQLEHLRELAPRVAAERAAADVAFMQERAARAELWDEAVRIIRPALGALTQPVTLTQGSPPENVMLIEQRRGRLYLSEDGKLVHAHDEGVKQLSTMEAVAASWRLDPSILVEQLDRQASGNLARRTAEAERKTAKLRAALALLK